MTQTEYEHKEQKKLECYRELREQDTSGLLSIATFEFIFDRAYILGKEKETITKEEIEKVAKEYAAEVDKNVRDLYGIENPPTSLTFGECAAESFREGVKFALGKETETIAQEDIEKAAEAFATPPIGNGGMFTREQVKGLLVKFAQLLSSDTEEEDEMLTISRKEVQEQHRMYRNMGMIKRLDALMRLFGSKCMPDEEQEITQFKVGDKVVYHPFKSNSFYNAEVLEIRDNEDKPYLLHLEDSENLWAYSIEVQSIAETYSDKDPKPAEPKFKVGDKVKDISSPHDDGIYKVDDIKKSSDGFIYHIQGLIGKSNVKESALEPCTEPKEDKHFDNIIKDSFSKERRLNIAAMAMQAIISRGKGYDAQEVAIQSLEYADALIKEE